MGAGEGGQRQRGRGRLGDQNRRTKRDDTFVSPCVKWLMFSFNMLFWLISLGLIAIGAWAYIETQSLNLNNTQSSTKSIFDTLFDVSVVFITFGCVVFVLAFMGAIGSLRENTFLLKTFAICLGVIFLLQVGLVIACFVLAEPIKKKMTELLQEEAIRDYRDDINRQNIIDWFQETFQCCGVGGDNSEGYKDWETNRYFNCTSLGFEACSVPYSCCKDPYTFDKDVANTRCGAGVLGLSRSAASDIVYTIGCIDSALQKAQDNMFLIGGIAIAIIIPQLIGIFLARVLSGQIEDQRARWGS